MSKGIQRLKIPTRDIAVARGCRPATVLRHEKEGRFERGDLMSVARYVRREA